MTEELNGGCLDEREAFEAWALDQGFPLQPTVHGDEYQDLRTQTAWEGFKVGRASLSTSKQAGAEPVAWRYRLKGFPWQYQDIPFFAGGTPGPREEHQALTLDDLLAILSTEEGAAPGAAIAAREQEAPSDDEQLVATLIHCSREVSPTAMTGYDLSSVLSRAAERIQSITTPPAATPAAPGEVVDKLLTDWMEASGRGFLTGTEREDLCQLIRAALALYNPAPVAAPAKNLITIDMDALARAIYSNTDASEQEARSIINTVGFTAPAGLSVQEVFARNTVTRYVDGADQDKTTAAPAPASETAAAPLTAPHLIEDAAQAHDQCRAVVHMAMSLAEVYVARAAILAGSPHAPIEIIGESSAATMEYLGDLLSNMDAVDECDAWLEPIFEAAQARWPTPTQGDSVDAPVQQAGDEHHGLDTDARVCFYEQDFYVLSNFSSFTLEWKGIRFDTSEAAYHWEKFVGKPAVMTLIQHAPSAHEAFKIAEYHKPFRRPDWDAVKVGIMREILRAKADQHEYVRRKLLATGDRELIENSWRDDYWGWGPRQDGQNMLGKLWMEVRAALKGEQPEPSGSERGEV